MRGYLSVDGADASKIPVESKVRIYRDPEGTHRVCARKDGKEYNLGVKDVTVSRLRNDQAPVIIDPLDSSIEVRNRRNSNDITVVCDGNTTVLEEGFSKRIDDTAKITVGYQTTFRLTVEYEAKTEINVDGSVGGDVVAGDKQSVDERTQVVDSVVNRSDIGGDESANVDDSVVNRSNIGDEPSGSESDTQNHCEKHQIVYTAEECPKCTGERNTADRSTKETKFCMFCGSDIPEVAAVCPDCGERLPDE